MTDAQVNEMFPTLVEVMTNENIIKVLSTEQKRAILEAYEVHVEEINDTHFRIGMLFVVLDVDSSDPSNPKMSMSMDFNKIIQMSSNS